MFIKVLIALTMLSYKSGFRVSNRISGIRGFQFWDGFLPESVFRSGSGFKFGFQFWMPKHSTRPEHDLLPSLFLAQCQFCWGYELGSLFLEPTGG